MKTIEELRAKMVERGWIDTDDEELSEKSEALLKTIETARNE